MDIRHFFGTKPKTKENTKAKAKKDNVNIDDKIVNDIGKLEPKEPTDSDEILEDDDSRFMIGKYNLYHMTLKQQRKNYQIFVKHKNNTEKIRFTLSWLKSPFGVEEYAHKEIINLEFSNYLKNNLSHNNFAIIKQVDDAIKNISLEQFVYIQLGIINEIKGLFYSPLIKMRPDNYDPLMRVHLRKTKNTITTKCFKRNGINNSLESISPYEIKGYMIEEIELEFSSLWISNDSYGIIIVANRIIIK